MAGRSLKLSPTGKNQVEQALTDKKWSTEDLAAAIGVQRATATNFRAGKKPVDRKNFVKFCEALGLDWQLVSEESIAPAETLLDPPPLPSNKTWIDQVREHCRQKILSQHSRMRLLSGEEIGVDQLYVDVWLLNRSPRTFQVSESKLLETFDLRNDRLGLGDRIKRNPGFEVANNNPKLVILGKPGSGKTTFLKHLAVDWCNGRFQPNSITILIELRRIRRGYGNLLNEICKELGIKDLDNKLEQIKQREEQIENLENQRIKLELESRRTSMQLEISLEQNKTRIWREAGEQIEILKKQVKVLQNDLEEPLRKGEFTILMDGLDEMSTAELRQEVQIQLQKLVEKFPRHRFVLTCRTQIMESIPNGFTSVEIADFSVEQVKQFVYNWFKASEKSSVEIAHYQRAFEHQVFQNLALKELTATPVILSLICLVLQDQGEVPSQINWLYRKGVKLLLSKWNDVKKIQGWKVGSTTYQRLSIEQKESLLTEIAARKFENPENFIIFEQKEIVDLISKYLLLSKQSEGISVLKSIEAQHGLLIERADELWSFSHLTFQEYFTVQWLSQLSSEQLAQKITNHRWQDIVKRMATSQQLTDQLWKLIKQAIDQSIVNEPVVNNFLVWVLQKSSSVCTDRKPVVIRAFYFDLACARTLNHHSNFSLLLALDRPLSHNLAISFDLDFHTVSRSKLSTNLSSDLDLDVALDRVLNRDYTHISLRDRLSILTFDCHYAYVAARIHAPHVANKLQQFITKLSNLSCQDRKNCGELHAEVTQWLDQLRQVIIEHRNISHDWQFKETQIQKLKSYYEANRFLVDLMKIDGAVSDGIRAEIEDTLFVPWEELQRRKI